MGSEIIVVFIPLIIPLCIGYFVYAKRSPGKRLVAFICTILALAAALFIVHYAGGNGGAFIIVFGTVLFLFTLFHIFATAIKLIVKNTIRK